MRARDKRASRIPGGVDDTKPLSSALMAALAADCDGRVTVAAVLDRVADRGFGLVLVLLTLPMLIPVMPPGTGAATGFVCMLVGMQMLIGMSRPCIPRRVREHRLSSRVLAALRTRGVRLAKRLERFSRPRSIFIGNVLLLRTVALLIIAMGLILFLPLPFMNTLPAISMLLMGIGLLNRDGVLVFAGMLLSVGLIAFVFSGASLLFQLWEVLVKAIR